MIKSIASLFVLYGMTSAQVPPGQTVPGAQIPAAIPPWRLTTAPAAIVTTAQPVPPVTTAAATTTLAPVVTGHQVPAQIPPIIPPIPAQTTSAPAQTTSAPATTAAPVQTTTTPATTTATFPATTNNGQYIPITSAPPIPVTTLPSPAQTTHNPVPPGYHFGFYGQLCPSPTPDAVCGVAHGPSFGAAVGNQVPGFTKCERSGDCCSCKSLNCGFGGAGCTEFSAGDYGAFGVQDIKILGRDEQLGGASIHCIGIEGCANSKISGLNVKNIDADKLGSLRNAHVQLTAPISDFSLDCIGEESCMGAKFDIVIPGPPPGFMCNPAFAGNTIEYAAISCYGLNACNGMEITIDNQGCSPIQLQQLECYAPSACNGAKFDFRGVTVNSCDMNGHTHTGAQGLNELCGIAPAATAPSYPAWIQPVF